MKKNHKPIEQKLISTILAVFGLHYDAVFSRCRKRELAICRQTIHTVFIEKLKYSDLKAAKITGHDRCTAINSYKRINEILETNYKPYDSYIRKVNRLCDIKYPEIKVKNYVFFECSEL